MVFPGSPRPIVPPVALLDGRERFRSVHADTVRDARREAERVPFSDPPPLTVRLGFWDRVRVEFAALEPFEQRVVRLGLFVAAVALGMCVVLLVIA